MENRKFLLPLSALAAIFVSGQADAMAPVENPVNSLDKSDTNKVIEVPEKGPSHVTNRGEQFNFVLKRQAGGTLLMAHESHYSHYSHESHASHQSHSSSYY